MLGGTSLFPILILFSLPSYLKVKTKTGNAGNKISFIYVCIMTKLFLASKALNKGKTRRYNFQFEVFIFDFPQQKHRQREINDQNIIAITKFLVLNRVRM